MVAVALAVIAVVAVTVVAVAVVAVAVVAVAVVAVAVVAVAVVAVMRPCEGCSQLTRGKIRNVETSQFVLLIKCY